MAVYSKVNLSSLKSGFRFDAEFYRPEYLFLDEELQQFNCKKINHFANVTDGEHGSVVIRDSGIKYLTAENVKNGYVDITKVRYVDEEVDYRNRRASVRVGDVLISIKGTLGEVAIAEEWLLPANMNRDVAIIKPYDNTSILPEYLTIFLMTKFGIFQGQREGSGGVQQMITLGRLREFLIPEVELKNQLKIKDLYRSNLKKRFKSELLYEEATSLMIEELGLNKVKLNNSKTYLAKFSDSILSKRFDGEYYKPRYEQLKGIIRNYKHGAEFLMENIENIRPNFNPSNSTSDSINYIELSNINSKLGIVNKSNNINIIDAPSRAKRKVIENDIIASSVVGSIDKAALITSKEDGHIASTGFFQFRSNSYSPQFLLLLLRSSFVTEQLVQESTGGILSAVPDSNLKNILIPKFPKSFQDKITKLVVEAHQLHYESKKLLEEAKQQVESFIESHSIN